MKLWLAWGHSPACWVRMEVRERQAPIGHRRGPHEGRDRKGDEQGDAEGFELTWPSGSSSQRNGGAPSDDNRGDGAQLQAMEFVDWDGHRILDMSGPEWHFMVESHRAVARKSARASTHTHSADKVAASRREYSCEVSLGASRSRAAACLGARDDAVVVRGRDAKKRRSSSSPTQMPFVTGPHRRKTLTGSQEGRTWSHQEGQDLREARAPQWRRSESSSI